MENKITEKVIIGLKHLYNADIDSKQVQVQKTRKEFDGDLTVVVFPFLRASKKGPEQTAEDLGVYIQENIEEITGFNVVKGFLNFEISPAYWLNVFKAISTTENFGCKTPNSESTIMVEYSSPNTNKPLHLGHLRNNFLGYSVAEILKANGHKVVKTQVINDRGIHICKSMLAYEKFGKGELPYPSNPEGLKGDHLVGKYYVEFDKAYKKEIEELVNNGMEKSEAEKNAPIFKETQQMLLKWEDGDTAVRDLWQKMNGWVFDGFESTYHAMGVDFDELYYESDTYLLGKDMVKDGLTKGVFYQKEDNSIWADLSDTKMDDKIMLRGDGTSVYMTQDVGTALERYKKHPDVKGMIYTVGNEQEHHFKLLFTILKKLGYNWAEGCYHLSYGMIELPDGKMKSREGTVVDADDLMGMVVNDAKVMTQERGHIEDMSEAEKDKLYNMIGMGGLKYFLLKIDPKKGMVFDPKESIDLNGNTGPFIQYAHARIQSLLDKAKELKLSKEYGNIEINAKEQEMIKLINSYPTVIKEAGENYSPAVIANYTYELVKEFNNFYQTVPIFKEEDTSKIAFRIALSETIGRVIQSAMLLLGVHVPNKM